MAKLSLNSACTCQGNFACLYFVKQHFLCGKISFIKDGASFCYCAYVLHISGHSGFLRNLPTDTTIFLRGLRLCGKSRS